jgi:hypothetical protein
MSCGNVVFVTDFGKDADDLFALLWLFSQKKLGKVGDVLIVATGGVEIQRLQEISRWSFLQFSDGTMASDGDFIIHFLKERGIYLSYTTHETEMSESSLYWQSEDGQPFARTRLANVPTPSDSVVRSLFIEDRPTLDVMCAFNTAGETKIFVCGPPSLKAVRVLRKELGNALWYVQGSLVQKPDGIHGVGYNVQDKGLKGAPTREGVAELMQLHTMQGVSCADQCGETSPSHPRISFLPAGGSGDKAKVMFNRSDFAALNCKYLGRRGTGGEEGEKEANDPPDDPTTPDLTAIVSGFLCNMASSNPMMLEWVSHSYVGIKDRFHGSNAEVISQLKSMLVENKAVGEPLISEQMMYDVICVWYGVSRTAPRFFEEQAAGVFSIGLSMVDKAKQQLLQDLLSVNTTSYESLCTSTRPTKVSQIQPAGQTAGMNATSAPTDIQRTLPTVTAMSAAARSSPGAQASTEVVPTASCQPNAEDATREVGAQWRVRWVDCHQLLYLLYVFDPTQDATARTSDCASEVIAATRRTLSEISLALQRQMLTVWWDKGDSGKISGVDGLRHVFVGIIRVPARYRESTSPPQAHPAVQNPRTPVYINQPTDTCSTDECSATVQVQRLACMIDSFATQHGLL